MDKGAEKKEEKLIEFYDDNFEEFPEDVEELNAAPDETNLWEDDWDNEDVHEDFVRILKESLESFQSN